MGLQNASSREPDKENTEECAELSVCVWWWGGGGWGAVGGWVAKHINICHPLLMVSSEICMEFIHTNAKLPTRIQY